MLQTSSLNCNFYLREVVVLVLSLRANLYFFTTQLRLKITWRTGFVYPDVTYRVTDDGLKVLLVVRRDGFTLTGHVQEREQQVVLVTHIRWELQLQLVIQRRVSVQHNQLHLPLARIVSSRA
jgi:hypothetical protein